MIADSSTLIIFAKINKLEILIRLYGKIYITKGIFKEIIEKGMDINAPDAKILKNFADNKKIEVLQLNKKYEEFSNEIRKTYYQLGIGEADVIALSLQEKKEVLIMDEAIGRKISKLYNLRPVGSLRVLLEAYMKNIINEVELRNIIKDMIANRFRIGADVISEFWELFSKIKKT